MNAQMKPEVKRISIKWDKRSFIIQKRKLDGHSYSVIGLDQAECLELMAELRQFAGQAK